MKALIFNSGLGSRLGELTANNPKCLVKLGNGETIFHRQLRLMHACGINEFVVTTGPFASQVEAETFEFQAKGCTFEFVNNDVYSGTNYIYSFWLAREVLAGHDILMLHGDLVFDAAYVQAVLNAPAGSLGSVNASLPLPPKDFKARIADGCVREVSVKIFDDDCVAFQPFYRLTADSLAIWLDAINRFVVAGDTGVYAENAANEVFAQMNVRAFSYADHFVEEVDTPEDLARVSDAIRAFDFAQQPVFCTQDAGVLGIAEGFDPSGATDLGSLMRVLGMQHPLVVTGPFFPESKVRTQLDAIGCDYGTFMGFEANPKLEEVLAGIEAFQAGGYDSLLSVGGGSAIDVAKCIKQFAGMDEAAIRTAVEMGQLPWRIVPHLAIPTTAGTGSESTHFAVMYVDGKKVSVAADGLQPNAVVLDACLLADLPLYQKKCTMLDALCQAIESYWSARSSNQSRAYSAEAIPAIIKNASAYLGGDSSDNERGNAFDLVAARNILHAANLAGKAINLTTTTAAHAMSYKLTSLYGIPHGHAVALCLPSTWESLLAARGSDAVPSDLAGRLDAIARLLCGRDDATAEEGLAAFVALYDSLELPHYTIDQNDIETLVSSVNVQRLSNFPLALTPNDLREMYSRLASLQA